MTKGVTLTTASTVQIAARFSRTLTLDGWNALTDAERLRLGASLGKRLRTHHGWPAEAPVLRTFGPPHSRQRVLQLRDGRSGLTFALIPGGTFRPGYTPRVLRRFRKVFRRLERDNPLIRREVDKYLVHYQARDAVTVGPLLMACELLLDETPGVGPLVRNPQARRSADYHARYGPGEKGFYPLTLTGAEVAVVNEAFGWDVPSSAEFEWALRGGREAVFFWGDAVPRWIDETQGDTTLDEVRGGKWLRAPWGTAAVRFEDVLDVRFPPDRRRRWPWCNRFGLAGMIHSATWCQPSSARDDARPLLLRGGTAWPWQLCGEWMGLLTPHEWRYPVQPRKPWHGETVAALRPVVRVVHG
jgi:hypothetical protein